MTRLLLDTHVFLWWRARDPQLTPRAVDAIASANQVYVSAASAWEAAIKIAAGRLALPEPFETGVRKSGFLPLPVDFHHAEHIAHLPLHHKDPFDRLLVAQARTEGLTLVSGDRRIGRYDVQLLPP
jgi:PIN domain nuclease of toxin-antitoxin system